MIMRRNPAHDTDSPPGLVNRDLAELEIKTLAHYIAQVEKQEKPKLTFEQWFVANVNPEFEDITFARKVWDAAQENV